MKHFPFSPTPVSPLPYYSNEVGCNLMCKRDDLFMDACGGNKARMLQYILYRLTEEHNDVVITAGPKSSNFNRACSLMCLKLGVQLHLVVYSSVGEEEESLNYDICKWANTAITLCSKSEVPITIQQIVSLYHDKKVLVVYGGGRSLEGVYAYYDAVEELSFQVPGLDHLFVACGTGTTLTGICAGMQRFFPSAQVHAISISRRYVDEQPVLDQDMQRLNDYLGTKYSFSNLEFSDSFLCGGYGLYDEGIVNAIRSMVSHEGIVLDPCYSGKAWYGMMEMIKESRDVYKEKNVLFWHTGGFLNFLSSL